MFYFNRTHGYLLNSRLQSKNIQYLSLCQLLCDPMHCSRPGSSIHGIFEARILEWVAISCSRGSFRPRDQTHVSCISCITGIFFTAWAIREAPDAQKKKKKKKSTHFHPSILGKFVRLLKCVLNKCSPSSFLSSESTKIVMYCWYIFLEV